MTDEETKALEVTYALLRPTKKLSTDDLTFALLVSFDGGNVRAEMAKRWLEND